MSQILRIFVTLALTIFLALSFFFIRVSSPTPPSDETTHPSKPTEVHLTSDENPHGVSDPVVIDTADQAPVNVPRAHASRENEYRSLPVLPTLDCSEKFMTYCPSSGWNNQRIALQIAMAIAITLNRTLIIPPVVPHYAVKAIQFHNCRQVRPATDATQYDADQLRACAELRRSTHPLQRPKHAVERLVELRPVTVASLGHTLRWRTDLPDRTLASCPSEPRSEEFVHSCFDTVWVARRPDLHRTPVQVEHVKRESQWDPDRVYLTYIDVLGSRERRLFRDVTLSGANAPVVHFASLFHAVNLSTFVPVLGADTLRALMRNSLRPTRALRSTVREIADRMHPYVALHVRGDDHADLLAMASSRQVTRHFAQLVADIHTRQLPLCGGAKSLAWFSGSPSTASDEHVGFPNASASSVRFHHGEGHERLTIFLSSYAPDAMTRALPAWQSGLKKVAAALREVGCGAFRKTRSVEAALRLITIRTLADFDADIASIQFAPDRVTAAIAEGILSCATEAAYLDQQSTLSGSTMRTRLMWPQRGRRVGACAVDEWEGATP
eukprot:TRINITY_DN14742_c0_g1_i1.p1 TRINITY_DN14742_c0_g1~~TRINITY_DN14742_c0_g1_i1.p1  ORF type:complete len:554 (+),score=56.16 TRINITY_DN14742_c0_g1_i1:91-1752(+)